MDKRFGSPTELVGEFTIVEIDALDFKRAEVALNELARYLDNAIIPMRGAERIAMEDMKERFETETAPDGNQWAQLDPDYAARKAFELGFEHPILTGRSRELKTTATSSAAWSVAGDSLFFSTEGLPEYWRVHQEGSEDFGSVFHHAFSEETGHLDSSEGSGAQNIPPRPFIGLSRKAETKILELFDIWFSEGIQEATTHYKLGSSGILHAMGPRGQFGPKIEF